MFFKGCLATGLLASGAAAARCAAIAPTTQQLEEAKQLAIFENELLQNGGATQNPSVQVNVYMHSVSATSNGLLSAATFQKQFDVLAADYAPSGFRMNLANTTTTVKPKWSNLSNIYNEEEMKRALRQGTYRDLNLYFVDQIDEDKSLGMCRLPLEVVKGDEFFFLDGCLIQAGTVPGGNQPPAWNMGKTVTHETGHWLGLFHTFEGGCTNPGDLIADTPASDSPTKGCPVNRDSCPKMAGLDPIHNYMDYSDDSCYEGFTKGQILRMHSQWQRYRAGK
ncbi:hypothetical protein E4U55_005685 [Claviceps digitariae]|nr:hypothetical protein E4U55_005685 [Claviceps digitariae]